MNDKELSEAEKKLLKDNETILNQYLNSKEFVSNLNSIYRYLANSNSTYQLNSIYDSGSNNPLNSIFSESVSIKELISDIVKMSKSKVKESIRHLKQKKGIIPGLMPSENKAFSVELEDTSFSKLALKRKKIREFRKKANENPQNSSVEGWSSVSYNCNVTPQTASEKS